MTDYGMVLQRDLPIQITGSQATVRVSRQDVLDGRKAAFQQTFTLVKGPTGWVIREIGQ